MIELSAKVEASALRAYDKRLAKNMGKPLATRAERGVRAASQRVLVPRIKAAAPKGSGHYEAGGYTRGGTLRRKVRSVLLKRRPGEFIKPTKTHADIWYAHFVIGGTKPHRLGSRGATIVAAGTDWVWDVSGGWMHPGATADPFIDRGVSGGAIDDVWRHVERDVFDLT